VTPLAPRRILADHHGVVVVLASVDEGNEGLAAGGGRGCLIEGAVASREMSSSEFGGPFDVARVSSVGADGRVYLTFPNGRFTYVNGDPYGFSFAEGDTVFLDLDSGQIEPAPAELWPDPEWVGVVKFRTPHDTVIELGGRLVLVKTNDVEYGIDNTVVASESSGVIRVLTETPIRSIDLGLHDEPDVERRFRIDAQGGPGFDEFAGMDTVKRRARELVELPLTKAEKLARIGGDPVKGILFTGDPGTGKTMLARIVAREAQAAFYLVSGSQVNSKWFGESEQTLHAIFQAAAKQPRSIIFFDEIDSIAGRRTGRGNEAQRAVVTQLLTEMDGFVQDHNVMVIAATNRPDDIDRALRRPGRFDSELHFPLPTQDDRLAILELTASKRRTVGFLPFGTVAGKTEHWSPAELAGIFSEAALLAAGDDREAIAEEDFIGGFNRLAEQHATRRPAEGER
jgi:transitional endoplasmic reticulum ATPase